MDEEKNITESEIIATYQSSVEFADPAQLEEAWKQSQAPKRHSGAYQNKNEKAEDVKSSAITLFLIGGLGLIADILCVLDLLPVHFSTSGKIITCGTMGILFLCMVVFGFVSVRSFKGLAKQASEEDRLTAEIEKWYKSELTKEQIEENMFSDGEEALPEEIKYFQRSQKILSVLKKKFMNLDEAYADNMAEKIYQFLYEET